MDRVTVGDIIEGVVVDFGMSGEGIVKMGAYPVFVPFAVVGETVRAKINYAKKDCAFADLIEVLTPSKDRIKPRCPHFGRCGGCDLQHLSHDAQEEIKRQGLARVLRKNAGLDIVVPEVVSGRQWGYRNKLWANENDVSVYDENTGKGLLRHLVARFVTTLSLTLSVNGDSVPRLSNLVKKLDRHFSGYAVYVSPQKQKNNVILGTTAILVHGKETPQDFGAFRAVVSPLSFLQVNDEMRDALYAAACEQIGDCDEIVELYSGVGLLTAEIASRLPSVRITAVEIVPEAVADAQKLTDKLGLSDRVREVCADAAEFMRNGFSESAEGTRRVVLLDPPRKGCAPEVVAAVNASDCEKVVYISCNPATLSRDIALFAEGGFTLSHIQPFDMFPETMCLETLVTMCLETLVLLSKKSLTVIS